MKQADIIASSVLILFSCLFLFSCIPAYCDPGYGTGMAPSLFPYVLSSLILGLSLFLLVKSLFSKQSRPVSFTRETGRHVITASALLCVSLLCIFLLGYAAGGICTVSLFLLYLGRRFSVGFLVTAVVLPLVLYAGLFYGLGAPMPEISLLHML